MIGGVGFVEDYVYACNYGQNVSHRED